MRRTLGAVNLLPASAGDTGRIPFAGNVFDSFACQHVGQRRAKLGGFRLERNALLCVAEWSTHGLPLPICGFMGPLAALRGVLGFPTRHRAKDACSNVSRLVALMAVIMVAVCRFRRAAHHAHHRESPRGDEPHDQDCRNDEEYDVEPGGVIPRDPGLHDRGTA
jgi:hypothetical protein